MTTRTAKKKLKLRHLGSTIYYIRKFLIKVTIYLNYENYFMYISPPHFLTLPNSTSTVAPSTSYSMPLFPFPPYKNMYSSFLLHLTSTSTLHSTPRAISLRINLPTPMTLIAASPSTEMKNNARVRCQFTAETLRWCGGNGVWNGL